MSLRPPPTPGPPNSMALDQFIRLQEQAALRRNLHVKNPFKHTAVSTTIISSPRTLKDDRPMVGQLMCDQTVVATNQVAKQFAREGRVIRERNRLHQAAISAERQTPKWIGRLQPLKPVQTGGPPIHYCRGIQPVSGVHYQPSASRSLQRRRILVSMSQENLARIQHNSLHAQDQPAPNTSAASTPRDEEEPITEQQTSCTQPVEDMGETESLAESEEMRVPPNSALRQTAVLQEPVASRVDEEEDTASVARSAPGCLDHSAPLPAPPQNLSTPGVPPPDVVTNRPPTQGSRRPTTQGSIKASNRAESPLHMDSVSSAVSVSPTDIQTCRPNTQGTLASRPDTRKGSAKSVRFADSDERQMQPTSCESEKIHK